LAQARKTLRGPASAEAAAKSKPTASAPVAWVPERGEVIWIQHSPALGHEIPELHPMLVASTSAFNARTGLVIGFPMTHSESHHDNPFALRIKGPKGPAFILGHQPKSFDWRARGAKPHPLGTGHQAVLQEALALLGQICGFDAK